MEPSLVYISVEGDPEGLDAFKVAAVRLPASDRPFPYSVGHSHNVTTDTHPVALDPDIRLEPQMRVRAAQAEQLVKRIHHEAGSPYIRVILFMEESQHHQFELAG